MADFQADGNIGSAIHADCENYSQAWIEGRYGEAERRAYTLLKTLHRELPTEKVQQVLGGMIDQWEATDG